MRGACQVFRSQVIQCQVSSYGGGLPGRLSDRLCPHLPGRTSGTGGLRLHQVHVQVVHPSGLPFGLRSVDLAVARPTGRKVVDSCCMPRQDRQVLEYGMQSSKCDVRREVDPRKNNTKQFTLKAGRSRIIYE